MAAGEVAYAGGGRRANLAATRQDPDPPGRAVGHGAGIYAWGGAAFAATFPVVALNGLSPASRRLEETWLAVLAVAAAVFCWTALRNASGKFDMLIDEQSQTLTLPQTARRRQFITFPRRRDSGHLPSAAGEPAVERQFLQFSACPGPSEAGAGLRREALSLAAGRRRRRGHSAQWLAGQLGLEFKGIEEENPRSQRLDFGVQFLEGGSWRGKEACASWVVKQVVLNPGESRAAAALDDNYIFGPCPR